MTYKEALDVLMHKIQIDVRYTTDFERDHSCLYKCKEALEKQIPQKARNVFHDTYGLARGMCPVCVNSTSEISLYCNMCGQRVFFDREDV